jgi:hypothetical protein
MSTSDRLDLQTLGSQLIMLKNLPNHWSRSDRRESLAKANDAPLWARSLVNKNILLGLVHLRSQMPSPTHVNKFLHESKVPTFEPRETIKVCFIFIKVITLLLYAKKNLKSCV